MRILELFSGTGIFSEVARARGHETFTIDLTQPADLNADILNLTPADIRAATGWDSVDVIWASPPCDGFSVAAIGKHWDTIDGVAVAKHATSRLGIALLNHTLYLVGIFRPETFFIENPRGMMRRMPQLKSLNRVTITYCQYGENFMKPTDIWTNARNWWPKPPCKNGDACHERAPRGSRTGLQGIKDKRTRAALPLALCHEVLEACESA